MSESSGSVEMRLWPAAAPGSEAWTQEERWFDVAGDRKVANVVVPTITPFVPEAGTGAAVVIAPGGGFRMLSWDSEGTQVAEWLCQRGIAAFVLKYRLVDTGPTDDDFARSFMTAVGELGGVDGRVEGERLARIAVGIGELAAADGAAALRLVRERASEWGVRPDRVGAIGFSAGAILFSEVTLTGADRPDFLAAVYGAAPTFDTVPPDAPPLFMVVAADDGLCYPVCMDMFRAWEEAGRPAELHVYSSGGHGFGMAKRGMPVDSWIERFGDWLSWQDWGGQRP